MSSTCRPHRGFIAFAFAIACFLVAAVPQSLSAATIEGFTEPYRKIDIGPAEPGLLAQVAVHEGDTVHVDQVVASLECDVLNVSLAIAQATMQADGRLKAAAAERELRRDRFEKLTELRAAGHASQEEVERARTELSVAEGNLQSAREQQAVDKLECQKIATMIERRKMRSPIEGVVTRVYKEEHELVAANATSVLTVAQLNPLRLTFSVPTANGLTLKAGDKVPLAFSETGEKASGTVELVAPITEAESGTVRLKLLIDNPHGAYRCGVRCAWDRPDDEDGPPEPATPDVESPNSPSPNVPAPNAAAKND